MAADTTGVCTAVDRLKFHASNFLNHFREIEMESKHVEDNMIKAQQRGNQDLADHFARVHNRLQNDSLLYAELSTIFTDAAKTLQDEGCLKRVSEIVEDNSSSPSVAVAAGLIQSATTLLVNSSSSS